MGVREEGEREDESIGKRNWGEYLREGLIEWVTKKIEGERKIRQRVR
jgi:hypothetical protein